ncbi:MAG: hydrogenase expression/formation protein [Thiobacillus sp. 65-69]|nr:hydrogenase expression/formation protein [Thiobacillus sp.]ODU89484.1 MAG: hypothetical protein ABT21_07140 [Thiobacillus sp. SCN 65-179]OJW37413.1 MAG: hydrogenase expression/formation protein [Thiobacillus sp. 65-69]
MRLEAIPIHTQPAEAGLTGNAPPLLGEVRDRVRRLLERGEASAIDLSALPLTPADLDWLRHRLGTGELGATLRTQGESSFDETACAGVWWVMHRNEQGAVIAQFIEVAFVPELVQAQPGDVADGLRYLESLRADG